MTHLVVLIPCFNEEKTLPKVLDSLPKTIKGISKITTIVIDDGSTDSTATIAKKNDVKLYSNSLNLGLGRTFKRGVEEALSLGADIVINIDGDFQYNGEDIPHLLQPILNKKADIVIGNRQISSISHFSKTKKFFQYFGSYIVRKLTRTAIPDAVSGFRAYNKESLLKINITSKFSYVLDSIVQASQKGLKIDIVDIKVNSPLRRSRLSKGIFDHILKSAFDIMRVFMMYKSFKIFTTISSGFFLLGSLIILRYLYFFFTGEGDGHIQSLIAAIILFIFSLHLFSLGVIGEVIAKNRQLLEDSLYLKKKSFYMYKK